MKVLLNALGATMGGAKRHLTNFLPELGKYDSSNEYVVLVRQSFPKLVVSDNISLVRALDSEAFGWFNRLAGDIIKLPLSLKREKYSAVVSITNVGPIWSPVPHIFFQRNALYYCKYYLSSIKIRQKIETIMRRQLAIESMKRADLIITPSNAMADMIKETCPQVRNRSFFTLYHGLNIEALSLIPSQNPNGDVNRRPTLFYASHLGDYKGFRQIFEATRQLKDFIPMVQVVLTINREDDPKLFDSYMFIVEKLGIQENIKMIGKVEQEKIGFYYKKADVFIFPSLCESFGFPLVEAMGLGVPIVASDTPSNREICGDAAEYFDPLDPKDFALKIAEILGSQEIKNRLAKNAKVVMSTFDWSWGRYAREFCNIIGKVTS